MSFESGADGNRSTTVHEVSDMVPTTWDGNSQSLSYQVSGVLSTIKRWEPGDRLMLFNSTALIICFFIDGNSIFQVVLCGTMWGLNRYRSSASVGPYL